MQALIRLGGLLLLLGLIIMYLYNPSFLKSTRETISSNLPKMPKARSTAQAGDQLSWDELEREKQFSSLAEARQNPEKVYLLYLEDQGLKELPDDVDQFANLQILRLHKNTLRELPESLGDLQNLQYLYLQNNQIETLPYTLRYLDELLLLDARANHLKNLNSVLRGLPKLEELDLSRNQLVTLPSDISYLGSLRSVRLGYNQLTGLPDEVAKLDKLELLDLSGNPSLDIRSTLIQVSKIPNLQILELNQLGLQVVPSEFAELRDLSDLGLRGNALSWADQNKLRKLLPNTIISF